MLTLTRRASRPPDVDGEAVDGLRQLDALQVRNFGRRPGQDHHELVAAVAAADVVRAQAPAQALRHGLQHDVAGAVAQPIVDDLEVVQVDREDRQAGSAALRARQLARHVGLPRTGGSAGP